MFLKGYIYNPPNNKNIQPVHGDPKFRTVELGDTGLGTLRTCARAPRERLPRARGARKNPPALQGYSNIRILKGDFLVLVVFYGVLYF
jgi:hypothetical protein